MGMYNIFVHAAFCVFLHAEVCSVYGQKNLEEKEFGNIIASTRFELRFLVLFERK